MAVSVEINNATSLKERLSNLSADAVPNFGKMTAQHMLEHLLATVLISNGKLQTQLFYSTEKAARIKEILIYSDHEFPMGFKAPMLSDELPALRFPDLEFVKDKLLSAIERFELYYIENKEATLLHPTLGELNYEEWVIFHNKHFTHHFKQFNI